MAKQESLKTHNSVDDFLKCFLVCDKLEKNFNFGSYFPTEERYQFRHPNDHQKFWELYCQLVSGKSGGQLGISEKTEDIMPLIVDFFILNKLENSLLFGLISCVQTVLLQQLMISDSKLELLCYVLKSEPMLFGPPERKLLGSIDVYDLRLQFPFCRISVKESYGKLIAELQKLINENFESELANNIKLFQDTLIKPVILYGSVDHPNMKVRKIVGIYGTIERDHIDGLVEPSTFDISEVSRPERHQEVIGGNIKN